MMRPDLLYCSGSREGKKRYSFCQDLIKDLNLSILFRSMARDDLWIAEVVPQILLIPLQSPEEVSYRHAVIQDFETNEKLLNELYETALRQKKQYENFKVSSDNNRMRSTSYTSQMLEELNYLLQGQLEYIHLREILEKHIDFIQSQGIRNLYNRLKAMPLEEILAKIDDMNFYVDGGTIRYRISIGGGLKISEIKILSMENMHKHSKDLKKKKFQGLYEKYIKKNVITLHEEELKKEVNHLNGEAVHYMLTMFRPYLNEMLSFYQKFAEELAFYKGVVQFMSRMKELGIFLTFPKALPRGARDTSFTELYELSMAIYLQQKPVGNSLSFTDRKITFITGANQGGKSTFLRSYGIAQLMMQCGMPVPAKEFCAPLYPQIFTHFTRREEEQLNSGRLREELKRMSGMIDYAVPDSLFLLNESFASTTEKEGSEIANHILQAFYDKGIVVIMVTHLYQLAGQWLKKSLPETGFYVAERKEDGTRTYKILPGEPGVTSYGTDLFEMLIEKMNRTK